MQRFFFKRVSMILAVVLVLSWQSAQAQKYFLHTEYGFQFGASTYFGDLNTSYGLHYIRPSGGIFIRHSFSPYIALRGMANYSKIGYEDRFSKNPYQKARNLKFRSNILEGALVIEFNFFKFMTGDKDHRFTPFLSGGFGVFYYNPYVNFRGRRYTLRGLGTEGQNTGMYDNRKYKSYSFCFPVGAGIKYWLGPGINLSAEVLNRFTLTDYIDDVSNTYVGSNYFFSDPANPNPAEQLQDPSILVNGQKLGRAGKQRGDNSTKDQYLMFNISISFQFKTYKCPTNWYTN